ncbi:MAG: hypothetical protein CME39_09775 [Haliea sp.]|nr:hypothetical protein [Haliea sp.]
MTAFRNKDCGHIDRAKLVALLPEKIPIRKGRNGALYLVSPWSAWYMNCSTGQDVLLEHGEIWGPGGPVDALEKGAAPAPAAPAAPVAPEPEPQRQKKRGFLDLIGDFD